MDKKNDETLTEQENVSKKEETAEEKTQAPKEALKEEAKETANKKEAPKSRKEKKSLKSKIPATKTEKNPAKLMTLIAVAVLVVSVIVGGVILAKNIHDTKASYTFEDGSLKPDSPQAVKEAHNEVLETVTGKDAIKDAEVKQDKAIDLISSFSDEELGIKKEAYADVKNNNYQFMVSGQAYIIKGESYVQVIAAEKTENKDGTFNIISKANYYISFDGKTVLKEDMKNLGTFEELKK